MPSDDTLDLLALLDDLRVIAANGLAYADDPYDEQRYERLQELVDGYYGRTLALPPEEVRERLADEFGPVTPKVGATGAVVRDDEVLTMRRPGGAWCLPGGNADPGEEPEETVRREVREETGLRVDPVDLVDAYLLPAGTEYDPHGAVTLLYRCERVGGELTLSHEGTDLRWQSPTDVEEWFADHERYARDAVG
ncbi:NUDIX hydrolase N-terminal domain-containing protein [Halorarius halobius]|uniref:NUDIX hydrolase N-terminal domain-containing protein n=1 Tax=Halorarius halobius TaxID=2962671 RepID=UPI0020CEE7D9|nr:NUDIX hydrolase N-terminal domain-containing protein [Halorarius halobius]